MSPEEFAKRIKAKYPEYNDYNDLELAREVVQKYPAYYGQVDFSLANPNKQKQNIFSETIEDIKEIGTGLKEDLATRRGKVGEIREASGEQSGVRSGFQKAGQVAGFASDVVGRTVVGAGKALLPQGAEDTIEKTVQAGAEKVIENETIQNILSKYEQLKETNPAFARDIEAALNIGLLGADVATAGVGGRAVNVGSKVVNKAIDVAETGVKKTIKGTGAVASELEGALTGTSAETLQQAFQSAYKGGEDLAQFTNALRNNVTPENLVNNMRESVDMVRSANTTKYGESLYPLINEVVDTTKGKTNFISKLEKFNVAITPDGLDFSKSKFRTVPQAKTKIQEAYNEIARLGDKSTLGDVDTTRQALRELTMTGDDGSARAANALIEDAITNVRNSGKQVKGYGELLSDFAENAEFLDEVTRSLSSGDKSTIDTAYRKLATSLKTNNERRMNLLKELDETTGGFILSNIAGQQLSEALPRGLFRQIGAGLAGAGMVTGGISSSLIVPMVFASPRVAGEVIRALGISAKKTKVILDSIESARKALNEANLLLPVASPLMQGVLSEEGQTLAQ
jgi:hypothetical protein